MLTRTACLSAVWGKRFARTEQQKERAVTSEGRMKKCTAISELRTVGVTMAKV